MTDLPVPLGPLVGSQPINVADAVERLARLQAVDAWIADVKLSLREWLMVEAGKVRASSGAAANWPVRSVGRALVTDPEPKPRVTDGGMLAGWLEAHGHGGLVSRRPRLDIPDQDAAVRAYEWLWGFMPGEVGAAWVPAAHALLTALSLSDAVFLPEDVLAGLVEDGSAAIVGADGQWGMVELDSTSGELGDAVPGVIVTRANETLTVTIQPDCKRRLSAELARILAPVPVLAEPEVGG